MVPAATVGGTLRTQMQGDCLVAVGMGLEGTPSRAQCLKVEPLDLPPLTRTSRTPWVTAILPPLILFKPGAINLTSCLELNALNS